MKHIVSKLLLITIFLLFTLESATSATLDICGEAGRKLYDSRNKEFLAVKSSQLSKLIKDGNLEKVKYLFESGLNLSDIAEAGIISEQVKKIYYDALLLRSARYGNLDKIKLAIINNANINGYSTKEVKYTPLMLAVACEKHEAVDFLISSGADVNAQGERPLNWNTKEIGITALGISEENSTKILTRILREKGAKKIETTTVNASS